MDLIRNPARMSRHLRSLHTTASPRYQHILYLGNLLGYQSVDRLSPFPRSWLDSVGVSADVDHGLKWTAASASPSHVLMSYRLLDRHLDPSRRRARLSTEELSTSHSASSSHEKEGEAEGEDIVLEESGEAYKEQSKGGVSKVFSIGRNTHAQLGLGFSSQEATRGMLTGNIEGAGGVERVAAGNGFSFVVTSGPNGSKVFGVGNDTLGQLGSSSPNSPNSSQSSSTDPYDISTRTQGSEAAQLNLLPLPKRINIDQNEQGEGSRWRVKDIATGIDHSLLLLERELNGYRIQEVQSTGLNTDGQLGLTKPDEGDAVPIQPLISRSFQPVPLPLKPLPVEEAEIVQVVAGADTSYALTKSSGIWSWGNSEYGQSFAGVHDRIPSPRFIPNLLASAYTSYNLDHLATGGGEHVGIKKIVAGGAHAAILDGNGKVWVCGFLPTTPDPEGLPPKDPVKWAKIRLVEDFPEDVVVEDLYSGLEYLVAITRSREGEMAVWIWGIPPRSISTLPIAEPTRVPWSVPKTPRERYLDENPVVKAKLAKQATEEENGGGKGKEKEKVDVIDVACTRDHLLVMLQDGRWERGVVEDKDVWAECVGPPRGKGTDVTL